MSWLELMCDFCRQILFLAIFTSAVGISAHWISEYSFAGSISHYFFFSLKITSETNTMGFKETFFGKSGEYDYGALCALSNPFSKKSAQPVKFYARGTWRLMSVRSIHLEGICANITPISHPSLIQTCR